MDVLRQDLHALAQSGFGLRGQGDAAAVEVAEPARQARFRSRVQWFRQDVGIEDDR